MTYRVVTLILSDISLTGCFNAQNTLTTASHVCRLFERDIYQCAWTSLFWNWLVLLRFSKSWIRNNTKTGILCRAMKLGCQNKEYPDKYGHYREAKYCQTKNHWFWKVWVFLVVYIDCFRFRFSVHIAPVVTEDVWRYFLCCAVSILKLTVESRVWTTCPETLPEVKRMTLYRKSTVLTWLLIHCCWTSRMEQSANPAVRVWILLGQFWRALKTHLFGRWQLQRWVTVFWCAVCEFACLLTYCTILMLIFVKVCCVGCWSR